MSVATFVKITIPWRLQSLARQALQREEHTLVALGENSADEKFGETQSTLYRTRLVPKQLPVTTKPLIFIFMPILTQAGDAEGMALGIERLLSNDPLRHRLSRNAKADAARRFDLQIQVKRYLEWYESILRKRPGFSVEKTAHIRCREYSHESSCVFLLPGRSLVAGESG